VPEKWGKGNFKETEKKKGVVISTEGGGRNDGKPPEEARISKFATEGKKGAFLTGRR